MPLGAADGRRRRPRAAGAQPPRGRRCARCTTCSTSRRCRWSCSTSPSRCGRHYLTSLAQRAGPGHPAHRRPASRAPLRADRRGAGGRRGGRARLAGLDGLKLSRRAVWRARPERYRRKGWLRLAYRVRLVGAQASARPLAPRRCDADAAGSAPARRARGAGTRRRLDERVAAGGHRIGAARAASPARRRAPWSSSRAASRRCPRRMASCSPGVAQAALAQAAGAPPPAPSLARRPRPAARAARRPAHHPVRDASRRRGTAARRHRQRQDGGLPAGRRRDARQRALGAAAGPRDRPHRPDRGARPPALRRRAGRRPAFGALGGRPPARLPRPRGRAGAPGRRRPLGGVRAAARPRADRRRRRARHLLQAGERAALRRAHGGALARAADGCRRWWRVRRRRASRHTRRSPCTSTCRSRVDGSPPPPLEVVDMRDVHDVFSPQLAAALTATVDAGEKAILFHNRRGYAGYLACGHCGHAWECPRCDVSLTLFGGGRRPALPHLRPRRGGADRVPVVRQPRRRPARLRHRARRARGAASAAGRRALRLDSDVAASYARLQARARPLRPARPQGARRHPDDRQGTPLPRGHARRRRRRRRRAALPRLPRRGAHLRDARAGGRPQRPRRASGHA